MRRELAMFLSLLVFVFSINVEVGAVTKSIETTNEGINRDSGTRDNDIVGEENDVLGYHQDKPQEDPDVQQEELAENKVVELKRTKATFNSEKKGDVLATVYPTVQSKNKIELYNKENHLQSTNTFGMTNGGLENRNYQVTSTGIESWWVNYLTGTEIELVGFEGTLLEGHLDIPYQVYNSEDGTTYTVVGIGEAGFANSNIESVYIPDHTIQYIRGSAFYGNNLTSITIPDNIESIGRSAFYGNELNEVHIGDGVTEVGEFAFSHNNIENLTIGNSVKHIGERAFQLGLFTQLDLPDSLETIGDSAFYDGELKTVNLGNGVTHIDDWAFSQNQIMDLTLGNSVKHIGDHSFKINELETINIPDNVEILGDSAFYENKLHTVHIGNGVTHIDDWVFSNNQIEDLTLGNSVKHIGDRAFRTGFFTHVDLPDSLETIDDYAFYGGKLKSVKFSKNLKRIGEQSFRLNNIGKVEIPDVSLGLTIGRSAFYENGTTVVDIGDGVTEIGIFAFSHNNIESLNMGNGVKHIGERAFQHGLFTHVDLPNSLETIDDYAFYDGKLESVKLSSNLKHIGAQSFRLNNIDKVEIPDVPLGLTIGRSAFYENGTTTVEIGNGVTHIDDYAFSHNQITELTLGNSVKHIGLRAFQMGLFTHVDLPYSLETIGRSAFINGGLETVKLPKSLKEIGPYSFEGNNLELVVVFSSTATLGESPFVNNPQVLPIVAYEGSPTHEYADSFSNYMFVNIEGSANLPSNSGEWYGDDYVFTFKPEADITKPMYIGLTYRPSEPIVWQTFESFFSGQANYGYDTIYTITMKSSRWGHVHFKGTNHLGNEIYDVSPMILIDKTKPTLTISPSTTSIVHEDITLTVTGYDEHSGVKQIQNPDGEWTTGDTITYKVTTNGTYEFTVEDNVGNQYTEEIIIDNIDKTLSFTKPEISEFNEVTLRGTEEVISTDITNVVVKDWREETNNWELTVSASKLSNGSHELPVGTMLLTGIKEVNDVSNLTDKGQQPNITINTKTNIDDGAVLLVESPKSRGQYDIVFLGDGLEVMIDPTIAKKGTYKSTITWDLVTAP